MKKFINLGTVNLGNLEKIHAFINNFFENKNKLESFPSYTEILTTTDLSRGDDLICMKYGTKNIFYTVKGEILKSLFDDWDAVQYWVESCVGQTIHNLPVITLCDNHIFRHHDLKRDCSVNVGLLNTEESITCFWEKNNLVDFVNYKVGEGVLANVKTEHSVIINDSPSNWKKRSILMWTPVDSYENIIKRTRA